MLSSYEIILTSARNKNVSALQAELTTKATIDIFKPGCICYSATSELAFENDQKSVEFLRMNGANINYIVLGAAMGGHREYAESLRQQSANIDYIAQGAARGGHREYAESLRQQGADINYIAQSAAMGGHREYAESLRQQGADINYIAQGAARGGHREYAESLRQQGANINYIAPGAAVGGHQEYAEWLRQQGANINDIALGAAIGGDRQYVESLRQQGINIDCIAQGAAVGGHREYAESLRQQGANINDIAEGAAMGGHREYAESLRQQGANINDIARSAAMNGYREYSEFLRQKGADMKFIAEGLLKQTHLTAEKIFRFLLYFTSDTFRDELTNTLEQHKDCPQNIKLEIPRIKTKIEQILNLKSRYHLETLQAATIFHEHSTYIFFLQLMPQWLHAHEKRPAIPATTILNIGLYLFSDFSEKELEIFQHTLTQSALLASIDHYMSHDTSSTIFSALTKFCYPSISPPHLSRALSFREAVVNNNKDLLNLCQRQLTLFSSYNRYDNTGTTPLINAIKKNNIQMVIKLLDLGADPNLSRKNDSESPLEIAVTQGNKEMVQILMSHKADPHRANSEGLTPYHIATQLEDETLAIDILHILGTFKDIKMVPAHEKGVGEHDPNDAFYQSLVRAANRTFHM